MQKDLKQSRADSVGVPPTEMPADEGDSHASPASPLVHGQFDPQNDSRICHIPVEILLEVADWMPNANVISWALTCKALWWTLANKYLPIQDGSTKDLLSLLESVYPGYLPCYVCLKFHYRDTTYEAVMSNPEEPAIHDPVLLRQRTLGNIARSQTATRYRKGMLEWYYSGSTAPTALPLGSMKKINCEGWAGAITVLSADEPTYYKIVQLALRYKRFGPQYGLPFTQLGYTWQPKPVIGGPTIEGRVPLYFFVADRVICKPRIIDDRLFFRIEHPFRLDGTRRLRPLSCGWPSTIKACKHLHGPLFGGFASYFDEFIGHLSSSPDICLDPQTICHKRRRCSQCATEFGITAIERYGPLNAWFRCRLFVWRDIGSARSSDDPLWKASIGGRFRSTAESREFRLDWEKLSFATKSLGDIYDARTTEKVKEMEPSDFVYF